MKTRILCFAEAFGFGPISKLLNFLDKLNINSQNCELIFFGEGCALDLAEKYNFSNIHCGCIEKLLSD